MVLARVTLFMALEAGDPAAYQTVESELAAALGGRGALIREVISRGKAGGNLDLAIAVLKNYTSEFVSGPKPQTGTTSSVSGGDAEVELFMQLARLQLENNDVPGAYDTLLTLARRRPDAEDAWKQLFTVAAWTGQPEKEKDVVALRLRQKPGDTQALILQARLLMDTGDYDQAQEILSALSQKKPGFNGAVAPGHAISSCKGRCRPCSAGL